MACRFERCHACYIHGMTFRWPKSQEGGEGAGIELSYFLQCARAS